MRAAVTMLQCWHRTPGGTARAAIEQAAALERTGEVELVGVAPMGLGRHGRAPTEGWRPPIACRHLPAPHQLIYESWHRWRMPPVQWVTGAVDLVHATTITVPPRRRGVPLVVTLHDLFPLHYPEQFSDRGRSMMRRGIDLARNEADVVLCSSDSTRDDAIGAGFDPAILRVVPLGVRQVAVSSERVAEVRNRYGLVGDFVLWVGTIEPRKNLAVLLEAWAEVDPRLGRLVLVGPDGWHVDLRALVAPLGDRVRALGSVSDADLVALNTAASVAVLPSTAEGFGLTALEAMIQSTPVVVSSGSASEEVVGSSGTVVSASDVEGWASALTELLADPEHAAAAGRRGQERAAGFTWERCAELTLDAYRSVL